MDLPRKFDTQQLIAGLLLFAGLYAVYWIYLPGLTAGLHFDTEDSLVTLDGVHDLSSALQFIFTGTAGPLGRPLSLATFILNSHAWPHDLAHLIHTNILLHLLNGALVAWVAFLIAREHAGDTIKATWIAVFAALLWLSSPLLASTTFLIIQRMTSLTTLLMLAGLASHLYLRRMVSVRPVLGFILLSASLGFFTLCAALSKENGLLLPVLVLVVEVFLLQKPAVVSRNQWRAWVLVCLAAPLVLILGYLATRWNYSEAMVLRREFSAPERLMTQAVILWEYLFNAALPAMHRLGPFHDHYPVARSFFSVPVLLSVIAWIGVVSAAILGRKTVPMFGFAVFWFLGAHLIESTVVPLELYFEHRNHVALVGPVIAVSYGIFNASEGLRRVLFFGLFAYLLLSLFVLFRVNTVWGDRMLAAEYWYDNNQTSLRASMHLAGRILETYQLNPLLDHLEDARSSIPEAAVYVDLQSMLVHCMFNIDSATAPEPASLVEKLDAIPFYAGLPVQFQRLREIRRNSGCEHFSDSDLYDMAGALLANRAYTDHGAAGQDLHVLKAEIEEQEGNLANALDHYEAALRLRLNPPILSRIMHLYVELGEYERACDFLDEMEDIAPFNPYLRKLWLDGVEHLREWVSLQSEQVSCL